MNQLDSTLVFVTRWTTSPSGDPDALRSDQAAGAHIAAGPRLSPRAQLEIYREQYVLRHTESVAEDYPGLCALVGDAAKPLVSAYVEQAMPSVEALRDLGSEMEAFLKRAGTLEAGLRERAIAMAQLEWAYQLALGAPAQSFMDLSGFSDLTEEDWPNLRFSLSPSLSLLDLAYPAAEHRRHLLGRSADASFDGRAQYAIYRNGDGVAVDLKLTPVSFELLRALGEGLPLGDACERTLGLVEDSGPSLEAELTNWFQSWSQVGILMGFVKA